jgi:hypothetical protein
MKERFMHACAAVVFGYVAASMAHCLFDRHNGIRRARG